MVRSRLVTGIPPRTHRSEEVSAARLWIRMPSRLMLEADPIEISIGSEPPRAIPQRAPALWWLKAAVGPQESTAAIQRPRRPMSGRPTA